MYLPLNSTLFVFVKYILVGIKLMAFMSKILITADWHLGKTYNGKSLLPFQHSILNWLVEQAISRQVKWFVIAGDIYDKRRPNKEEMQVLETLLHKLNQEGIHIVIIAGNHDGEVLTLYSSLLHNYSREQLYLLRMDTSQHLFPKKVFEINGFSFYALPYIDSYTCQHLLQKNSIVLDDMQQESLLNLYLQHWINALENPEKTILITHLLPSSLASSESGADEIVGRMLPVEPQTLQNLKHTFAGHIHRSMTLKPNITFAGAPYHLNPSDKYKPSALIIQVSDDLAIERIENIPPLFQILRISKQEEIENLINKLTKEHFTIIKIGGNEVEALHKAIIEKLPDDITVSIEFEKGSIPVQNFSKVETTKNLHQYSPLSLIQTYAQEVHKAKFTEEDLQTITEILEKSLNDETA